MGRIGRRFFITSGLAVVSAWVAGTSIVGSMGPRSVAGFAHADGRLGAALAVLFSDRDSAVRVGDAYLSIVPEERDPSRLESFLAESLDWQQAGSSISREDLVARIDAARRADFASGRTVFIDGWLVARTEARLCGYVACSTGV